MLMSIGGKRYQCIEMGDIWRYIIPEFGSVWVCWVLEFRICPMTEIFKAISAGLHSNGG